MNRCAVCADAVQILCGGPEIEESPIGPVTHRSRSCKSKSFCIIFCMMATQLSPNTMILAAQRDAMLLKIRGTSREGWIRSQTLYPAELRAHIFGIIHRRGLCKFLFAFLCVT